MEVLPQQPFYVYGHGWASCNPDASMQAYELQCKKLQVGDVCMSCYTVDSLINHNNQSQHVSAPSAIAPPHSISNFLHHHHSEPAPTLSPSQSQVHKSLSQQQPSPQQSYYPYYGREEVITQLPQNLSRRTSNTIPTTATGTTVTSRPITTHFDSIYDKMSSGISGITVHSPKNLNHSIHSPYAGAVPSHIDTLGSDGGSRTNSSSSSSSYSGSGGVGVCTSSGSISSCTSSNCGDNNGPRSSSNQSTSAVSMVVQRFINDEQLDQINSKKRRWSAPTIDNICDDDQTVISDEKKILLH